MPQETFSSIERNENGSYEPFFTENAISLMKNDILKIVDVDINTTILMEGKNKTTLQSYFKFDNKLCCIAFTPKNKYNNENEAFIEFWYNSDDKIIFETEKGTYDEIIDIIKEHY